MTPMPHLLVVDDDQDILTLLGTFLRKHQHRVSTAQDGAAMFAILDTEPVDLIILDIMLQHEDGFSLCQRLRATSRVPVIMLSAMADHTDRVVGLEIGADDYLTKPFDQRELLARVKAVLRRSNAADDPAPSLRPSLRFGSWILDVTRRELRASDSSLVPLSGGEFDLLLSFAEHPQRVLTRDQLMDMARGPDHAAFDRSIDVQVSRLRAKLEEDPRNPTLIRTVRNGGYLFASAVKRS
ncbi:response regulator [Asaia krungthepensis]|uniref:Two component response regulator n=2 Tax=Asaia TaxID=91914 RepID=A0ABQ0Q070_9PROT|nr:response regulator transcription factor [Asaia krungthepensis]GBQ85877.1 two component response regulator [Asaia krungthepensis NRIC 0535]